MRTLLPVMLGLCSAVGAQEIAFRDRTPVPAYELHQVDGPPVTSTGGRVSSRDLYGHVTVLEIFYPGCGPCTTTHNRMQHLATAYSDSMVRVFAVSADTNKSKIREWLKA
jgi:peroxiredoxin